MEGRAHTRREPEATILVESYNAEEGSSDIGRLLESLRAADAAARRHGSAEVVLADSSGDAGLHEAVEAELHLVRRIAVAAGTYDEAKLAATAASRGRYVVFLDGDCVPATEGWLEAHLSVLRAGAPASAGATRYEGGYLERLLSIIDFGFSFAGGEGDAAQCYASNNIGFRREVLESCPVPEGGMRCNCYLHAQRLLERGTAARHTPDAVVEHEVHPFWEERLQRGYDLVASAWANPALPERRFLILGPLAAPLFWARGAALDLIRLPRIWRQVGLSRAGAALAVIALPIVRLTDLPGLLRALATPPRRRPRGVRAASVQT